jgi:hypothetical protein
MLEWVGDKVYWYRYENRGGKTRRVYVAAGEAALAAAREQEERHRRQHAEREAERVAERRHAEATAPLHDLIRTLDLVTKATLLRLGFHQHDRTWRLKDAHGRKGQAPHGAGVPGGAEGGPGAGRPR